MCDWYGGMWNIVQGHCDSFLIIFFFRAFTKALFCFPVSSTQRNEFISAAAKSGGKMSKQHTMLALPAWKLSLCQNGAFRQHLHGRWGCCLSFCPLEATSGQNVLPWIHRSMAHQPWREKGREKRTGKPVCLMELAPWTDVLTDATPQMQICSGWCQIKTEVQITC